MSKRCFAKRAVRLATPMMLLLVLATLLPAPAYADFDSTADPVSRCQSVVDRWDDYQVLHMDGGRAQLYPPNDAIGWNYLNIGDVVRIEPVPTDIVYDSPFGTGYTPLGDQHTIAGSGFPAPGAHRGSLLLSTTGVAPMEVMTNPNFPCFRVGAPIIGQPLTLQMNDSATWDNHGAWNVTVRLYRNPVRDGDFEAQPQRSVSWPWLTEGVDPKGIDINLGFQHSGTKNAFIRAGSRNWNALVQDISVRPNTNYRLNAWLRTSPGFGAGFFGVRAAGSNVPLHQVSYGSTNGQYQLVTVPPFNTGAATNLRVFVGYWAPGFDSWVQIDGLSLNRA